MNISILQGASDNHDVLYAPSIQIFSRWTSKLPVCCNSNTKSKEYICVYTEPWFHDVILGDWGDSETDL